MYAEAAAMKSIAFAFTMYPVTDMARAVAFYEDRIGLEKCGLESPYWVEFEIDGATFGIGNFEQVGVAGTAQSLALEIPDLEATIVDLRAHGIEVNDPVELANCRIAFVLDPDGNRLWLHQKR